MIRFNKKGEDALVDFIAIGIFILTVIALFVLYTFVGKPTNQAVQEQFDEIETGTVLTFLLKMPVEFEQKNFTVAELIILSKADQKYKDKLEAELPKIFTLYGTEPVYYELETADLYIVKDKQWWTTRQVTKQKTQTYTEKAHLPGLDGKIIEVEFTFGYMLNGKSLWALFQYARMTP
ncbi:hypothetical protein C4573_01285 [Candidatus Woesearchaeota archaeon]|nr:MAG: hypothetical protein C4573_01285 [Candidatus Woesearchaeota archaeon]